MHAGLEGVAQGRGSWEPSASAGVRTDGECSHPAEIQRLIRRSAGLADYLPKVQPRVREPQLGRKSLLHFVLLCVSVVRTNAGS